MCVYHGRVTIADDEQRRRETSPDDSAHTREGLRERKKRLTRQRLHRCALELTLARGLGSVTVDAIAEAAEVSPRTFFNYFRSKESAILGLPEDIADRLEQAMRERPHDEDPLLSAQHATRPFIEKLRNDDTLQRLRRAVFTSNPELSNGFLQASAGVERAIAQVTLERLLDAQEPGQPGDPDRGARLDDLTASATPEMRMHSILVGMAAVGAVRATLAARAHSVMDRDTLLRFYDGAFAHVRAGLPDPRSPGVGLELSRRA